MGNAGIGKWVVAATAVLVSGTLLTIFDLRSRVDQQQGKQNSPQASDTTKDPTALQLTQATTKDDGTEPEAKETKNGPPTILVTPPPEFADANPIPGADVPARLFPLSAVSGQLPADDEPAGRLRREGTLVSNVKGSVRTHGNRLAFFPSDGTGPYILLENQLLERVEFLQENGGPIEGAAGWILTGTLTEYHRVNYLLIKRMEIESP